MKLIAITAASILMMAGTAQAQMFRGATTSGLYGELGYTALEIEESGFNVKPSMLRGVVGFDFGPYLAVEGMAGFGIADDSASGVVGGFPVRVETEVRRMLGVYVKPKAMIGDAFEIFGRLGYSDTRLRTNASVGGISVSGSDSGSDFAYGLGAKFNFNPRTYVALDYMRYYDKEDVKLDGVTIGVGMRF